MCEITAQPRLSEGVYLGLDIEISDDTLLVADRDASTVEYYQLHD